METSRRDDFIIAIRSAFLQKGSCTTIFIVFINYNFSLLVLFLDVYKVLPLNIFRSISKDIIYRGSFISLSSI